ncbi:MAG: undecaprenyl diphosphate synthase family protein [Acidiferrobacter sp.]
MKSRVPQHIGFIPDGNRRWAKERGLPKEQGYAFGVEPGIGLYERCREIGVHEISIYGFTRDNTKRPVSQKKAFARACVQFAEELMRRGAALLVVGDESSTVFPQELRAFRERQGAGMKVNLLVNYGWDWDIQGLKNGGLRSAEVSRLDLIVRWGGGRRLSGFLPIQSVYADFFIVNEYWPDFEMHQFEGALRWFRGQDRTLGG